MYKRQVLGFSGLVGAGRTEVMRAIIGADPMRTGEVYLEGKKIVNHSPKEAMENGIVPVSYTHLCSTDKTPAGF